MRARASTRLLAFLMVSGPMAGALASSDYSPPTIDAFLHGIRTYPYVASDTRRARIKAGVPRLTQCMPAAEVRKHLGEPDFGYVAYRAGTAGKVPSKRIWNYVLEKRAATETEPGSRVVVWLENDGRLRAVTVHGAPDIESFISRNGPGCQ